VSFNNRYAASEAPPMRWAERAVAACWAALHHGVARWRDARRHARDRELLRQMSDRALADLGLGRDQIDRVTDPAQRPGEGVRR
jgi:uncharacterized protein YjiS (DUF1127 family)